jgi:ectoine hydroxylase-related dioxygenase (phytanoyl-CoA dioxygenase family)
MDDTMRDTFARQGYVVVPDVLDQQQLDELNDVYDQQVEREETLSVSKNNAKRFNVRRGATHTTTDRHGNTYEGRRLWSKAYRDLIDNETMLPIVEEILSDPSWGHAPAHTPDELRPLFRLDHDNVHFKTGRTPTDGADKGGTLHGGPGAFHITCVYELKDVGPGDGGFGCVPGTHKPENEQKLLDTDGEWRANWVDTEWTSQLPNWNQDVPVHRVEAKGGDCILFTEKLKHGTIPWSGSDERRTLFYKYVPFGMHHRNAAYDTNDPDLTERQKRILEFSPCWFNEPREDRDYSGNPALTELHPQARAESDPSVLMPGMCPPHIRLTDETTAKLQNGG